MNKVFLILCLLASPLLAQSVDNPSPTPPIRPLNVKGKCGVGVDSLDAIGTGLSFRFWLSEQTALDLTVGGSGYYSRTIGTPYGSGDAELGGGIGLKWVISRPVREMLFSLSGRVSFVRDWTGIGSSYTDWLSATAGFGFEVFMPFYENISLEGWTGLNFSSYGNGRTSWGVSANGLETPLNLGIHFYL